ncbi:tetratricopeptide repeat protein [Sphingobium sp. HBC34]|uniref:Tetratricopeptide repeat protein n=1 Tax=Sphingobium cyanobacteriorum TaxID=3063954 RepID=A0ABT8ZP82_9SPHN|nr:tetratricopeptide repeat protein [Sphingobium sp. HBC34]MDO7836016.1 tetratricopeptide repeat protein [Sphingobium sp. HBC34]
MATKPRKMGKAGMETTIPTPPPAPDGDPVRYGLYGNGHTSIEYLTRATPSTKLGITFSSYGDLDLSQPGFAEDFLIERGYDVLTLKCNINNWFQDVSADVLKSVMGQLPAYDEIITYGSSMGGYAAMYFAQTVGARTCIALSPQFSIDPSIVSFESRWAGDAARIHFTHERLDDMIVHGGTTYYVLFDPHTLDKQHAEMMTAACNRVLAIAVPHSGHPSILALQEMELLAGVFDSLAVGQIPDLGVEAHKHRRNSPSYFYSLAHSCLDKGKLATAERLLAHACEISDRADIQLSYSRVLLRCAKVKKALDMLDLAWPKLHHNPHLIAYRAHLQHLNGQIDEACQSFETAIAKQPDFLPFYQGERAMLKETLKRYENEKRLREAALARARAELEMHNGQSPRTSRSLLIALAFAPLFIIAILISVAITLSIV